MARRLIGKVLTSTVLETMKENIHRQLDNYCGIEVTHFRRDSDARDQYYDAVDNTFTTLGKRLIQISSQDYDVIIRGEAHAEPFIPIRIFLDPTIVWKEHDEIRIVLDLEDRTFSQRFELVRIDAVNKNGITTYLEANIAPVRAKRVET